MSQRYASEGGPVARRPTPESPPTWGERIRYHGMRAFLLIGLAVFITVFFPPTEGLNVAVPGEGEVAQETVTAEIGFSVPKTPEELDRDRRLAMETVPPTFQYRPEAADSMQARLQRFFDGLDSLANAGDTIAFGDRLRASQIAATPTQVAYLIDDETRALFRSAAIRAAREVIPEGVVDPARMLDVTTETVTISRDGVEDDGSVEESESVEDIRTSADFYSEAVQLLPPQLPPDASALFRLLLIYHLEYSLELDLLETQLDQGAARESVPLTKGEVLDRQVIVRAGDVITPEVRERLDAYYAALRARGDGGEESLDVGALLGAGLLNFLLLSIFGLLVYFARPEVYANYRWLLLIAVLTAVYFGAGVGIDRGGLPAGWLPIAFVALPVAVLWDTRMALLLVLVLAAITSTLEPFSDQGTVLGLMAGGAAASMSVRAVRRRSETWVSIAIISGVSALTLLAYGLANSSPLAEVAGGAAILAGNATGSALLAMGFLWVFEMFTGITTVQTLLEWADPTRPLLRRLAMEAPGTYAHTINVANLAEAAATRIDANGLLCRVGVLYHDVGKMLKPHYFVENQPDDRNPHDKLKPETSAGIVLEHVTEGARLARDANVPEVVVDFIFEHHGTQRIGFFYEKALEEADEDDEIDPQKFTYPGPKPRSKETAIVMLADSCESAGRAMQDASSERVRDLIDNIVEAKIADGQLDESPLTLQEIALIKEQFVSILSGVHHRRIEYPGTKHLTDSEEDAREPAPAPPVSEPA